MSEVLLISLLTHAFADESSQEDGTLKLSGSIVSRGQILFHAGHYRLEMISAHVCTYTASNNALRQNSGPATQDYMAVSPSSVLKQRNQ